MPVVLAGNGAVRTPAATGLQELVEHAGVAVVATYMGKGAISDRTDSSLMTLDSGPDNEASTAIKRADCVLAEGYDIAEHDPESWNPDLDKTIVHVDHEPAEVYRHYNPDVELVADISAVLSDLWARLNAVRGTDWCHDLRERIIEDVRRTPDSGDGFSVKRTLPYLREAMADEDVLISDVGSHKMAIVKFFPTYEPNTCIVSNGLASMGIGVPGGIAADLATDANVVVATGDGGFLMNAAELETATRLGLGYTIIIFNDNDYGLISEKQIEHTGNHFGTELTNPDFKQFAESFDIEGYRPDTWAEVETTLKKVVPSNQMSLVEIQIP